MWRVHHVPDEDRTLIVRVQMHDGVAGGVTGRGIKDSAPSLHSVLPRSTRFIVLISPCYSAGQAEPPVRIELFSVVLVRASVCG